jgi:hypothetical protein
MMWQLTAAVELQLGGADGDGDGLLADGLAQRVLVRLGHILEAVNGHRLAADGNMNKTADGI